MNQKNRLLAATLIAIVLSTIAAPSQAAIIISEVDPSGSGNSAYSADWFELTNTGTSTVNISGWKMDDNSNLFANAVTLNGVTSIAAGQSVVFIETSSLATTRTAFINAWFGGNAPTGFTMGSYSGAGVGLGTTSDAVNIFDSAGTLITRVDFGAATSTRTFDNAQGLNNVVISQLSAVGVNGAFLSVAANGEIGSPGAVPVPATAWLFGSALGWLALIRRRAA